MKEGSLKFENGIVFEPRTDGGIDVIAGGFGHTLSKFDTNLLAGWLAGVLDEPYLLGTVLEKNKEEAIRTKGLRFIHEYLHESTSTAQEETAWGVGYVSRMDKTYLWEARNLKEVLGFLDSFKVEYEIKIDGLVIYWESAGSTFFGVEE